MLLIAKMLRNLYFLMKWMIGVLPPLNVLDNEIFLHFCVINNQVFLYFYVHDNCLLDHTALLGQPEAASSSNEQLSGHRNGVTFGCWRHHNGVKIGTTLLF